MQAANKVTPDKTLRVALAGNPNSGKTALFNALTGLHYKVANYPGVTVERKQGSLSLPDFQNITLIDMPGAYSLDSSSMDEQIATKALLGEIPNEDRPDLIVSVVDSTNLDRNLFFTSQLIDLDIPIIVALSLSDLSTKEGITIRTEILSRYLSVPVISVSSVEKRGLESLRNEINVRLKNIDQTQKQYQWCSKNPELLGIANELAEKAIALEKTPQKSALIGFALLSEARSATSTALRELIQSARSEVAKLKADPFSIEATLRYAWIKEIVSRSVTIKKSDKPSLSDRLDKVLTHRIFGMLAFVLIMSFIFQSIFFWAQLPMGWIDSAMTYLSTVIIHYLPAGELRSLLVDGIIAGVGSVLIFIPQIAILFFFIGILEDSGYLARAAFVTDKVMRKFGLQGRSFVPLLSSFACAIPGIMATRTIPTFADRLVTILIAPLMSCSARLPVYSLLIAAFIPAISIWGFVSLQGAVLLSMYFLGIAAALVVAWLLKLAVIRGKPAPFVMEMPALRIPSIKLVLRGVYDRIVLFVKDAGTVILACSIILWFLASHPSGLGVKESYAGQLGKFIEPILAPIGLSWEVGIGIIASFAAREVFISALATVYSLSDASDNHEGLLTILKGQHATGSFSLASALSLMVFYVFACQCMSTLAVTRRETGTWRWPIFMFCYMTVLAYVSAFICYRIALFWQ